MPRTAREVVELYNLVVWNERDLGLARELLGESVVRHGVGETRELTHEQAVSRVESHLATFAQIAFALPLVYWTALGAAILCITGTRAMIRWGAPVESVDDGNIVVTAWEALADRAAASTAGS